jgi:hypothetical protein
VGRARDAVAELRAGKRERRLDVRVGAQKDLGSPTLSATMFRTIWFVTGPIW